jgi:hypothetical protein
MALDILVSSVTHSRSALRPSHFSHSGFGLGLLRPLLTSRSGTHRHPFRRKARSPRVRTHSVAAQPPDLRHPSLDHESFAVSCPLALPGGAFYPVLVHRLAASLHASSPRSVTLTQLRFASFAVINSREDLHLQECARAGRTRQRGPKAPSRASRGGRPQRLCQKNLYSTPNWNERPRGSATRDSHELPAPVLVSCALEKGGSLLNRFFTPNNSVVLRMPR